MDEAPDDSDGEEEGESSEGSEGSEGSEAEDAAATSDDCEPGPGKTITPIEGFTIEAQHEPEIVVEDQVIAGETIPGFVVPELDLPEQTVEAGCVVEYDAPGGCLGKVEITGFEIPERAMPGYEIPEVVTSDGDVLFEFDEAELGGDALPTLEAIVAAIETDFSAGAAITVEGHTDSRGDPDYNQTLSEGRADAVAEWLTSEGGIDQSLITTAGYGETLPVAPNENEDGSDNPEGREQNRRVVITVTPQ